MILLVYNKYERLFERQISLTTDKDIIKEIKHDRLTAFKTILNDYEFRLFQLVNSLICHYQDAEDVTQEVFIKVYQNLHTFDGRSSLYHWISRIARNQCLNYLNRKSLIRFMSMEWFFSVKNIDFQDHSSLSQLVENAEQKEQMKLFYTALKKLPYKHREILVLSEIQDMAYKDISVFLQISEGTVKSRLSRAKKRLKEVLKDVKI